MSGWSLAPMEKRRKLCFRFRRRTINSWGLEAHEGAGGSGKACVWRGASHWPEAENLCWTALARGALLKAMPRR